MDMPERKSVVRMENWSVVTDPFASPEMNVLLLHGTVYGHPLHRDGKEIRTSQVKNANGLIVETYNTTYQLGTVEPEYQKWCEDNGIELNLENPIKVHNDE